MAEETLILVIITNTETRMDRETAKWGIKRKGNETIKEVGRKVNGKWMDRQRERERWEMEWGERRRNEVIRGAEREGEGDYGRKIDGCCDKDGG